MAETRDVAADAPAEPSGGSGDAGGHPPPSTQDALELLFADHRRIDHLLDDCARLAAAPAHSEADRSGLLARLGALLNAHATLEQELFYPALVGIPEQVSSALAEHAQLTGRLEALSQPDLPAEGFGEALAALAQGVRAHMGHEEVHLFPAALTLDLQALGTRLALRRGELLGDQGVD
jgi:hypothetical protein